LDPARQGAFACYSISYLVVPLGTPKSDVYEVYEDINSGGTDLTQQQLRRAVFHGPYMKMIDKLEDRNSDFQAIFDPKAFRAGVYQSCKKDSDGELILRAFAFRRSGEKFKPSLKKFLNRELEGSEDYETSRHTSLSKRDDIQKQQRLQMLLEMIEERKREFESVMKVARQVFGDRAFRKKQKQKDSISNTMWDAKYCAIAELLAVYKEVDFTKVKGNIAHALLQSIQSGFFSDDDEETSAVKFLARKEYLKKMFQDAIVEKRGPARDKRRQFSPSLKRQLFEQQTGLCGLCDQTIDEHRLEETNYVHIDHIVPHSQGGLTDVSNAQLTHSECNLHKGARTNYFSVTEKAGDN
jgi:HNH endonuclease